MLPFRRPAVFRLTATTPSPITYDQDISPKHSLDIHDLDGQNREWVLEASVSKISIYKSHNLTLRLPGRIVTSTIDVWQSSNLTLIIDSPSQLGTLQLDPTLNNVHIIYNHISSIGKIVLAPARSTSTREKDYGFRSLSFQARGEEKFVLADEEGTLINPQGQGAVIKCDEHEGSLPAQLVLSYGSGRDSSDSSTRGWRMAGLERGAKDYPIL